MVKKKAAAKKPAAKSKKPGVKTKVKNYDQDFEYICLEIEKGIALRNVCHVFMGLEKFYSLIKESEEKAKRYARACEGRSEAIFEDMLEIADSSNADVSVVDGKLVVDGEAIQRAKLRIETRKWMLSKLAPKKYGDKIEIDANVKAEVTEKIDTSKLSTEELKNLLDLQRKAKALK